MSKESESTRLFQEAVEMKRQGNFARSIELQKQSVIAWPQDPELASNFYSMGKTYYLLQAYKPSFLSYKIYADLCSIKNPAILEDYRAFLNGDNFAAQRLNVSFRNLAHDLGHTIVDGGILPKCAESPLL